jgi:hypothetical protein
MNKRYFSLGLMSGTSGDGVDASIIESDGINQIKGLSIIIILILLIYLMKFIELKKK